MDMTLRRAVPSDESALRRAVYAAWRWREPWDETAYQKHHRSGGADSYVDGFGTCPGDVGVVAVTETGVCGAAWFRFFTREAARAGYVDDAIPELVLAVNEHSRGVGIGGRLLDQLLDIAVDLSIPRISLHVDAANARAIALYRSRELTAVQSTPNGTVMMWIGPHEGRTE